MANIAIKNAFLPQRRNVVRTQGTLFWVNGMVQGSKLMPRLCSVATWEEHGALHNATPTKGNWFLLSNCRLSRRRA
jgi:hypothetical protein